MDVEKVRGPSGQKGVERKERKSTPDSEEFREMMRTGKVGEAEFEKPKKRKFGQTREEKGPKTGAPPPKAPPMPGAYEKYPTIRPSEKPYEGAQPVQEPEQEGDKKTKEKKKEEQKEEAALLQKSLLEGKKVPKKEKEKKVTKKAKPTTAPAPKMPKEEKEGLPIVEKPKEKEEKKKKPEKEIKPQVSTVLQEFPPNIASQTGAITATLTPYLHPDIVPLFEKMVGTIIQIKAQGVTQTEVMLNSPAFTSSLFFGSSIVVQKYSTAPDSFNIFLKGPAQAVNMFTENLDGLFDAFKKANINIGRLEAQHEKPLFKRKEKTGEKGDESLK